MLRELNENEMEMVSGGTEDEVVVTGTRVTRPTEMDPAMIDRMIRESMDEMMDNINRALEPQRNPDAEEGARQLWEDISGRDDRQYDCTTSIDGSTSCTVRPPECTPSPGTACA